MIPTNLYTYVHVSGSLVICDPPVLNTDIDLVYYCTSNQMFELLPWLDSNGWAVCATAEYNDNGEFTAYRKGIYNIIICVNEATYLRYEAAKCLARNRNLINKEDRVRLFDLIVKGYYDPPI